MNFFVVMSLFVMSLFVMSLLCLCLLCFFVVMPFSVCLLLFCLCFSYAFLFGPRPLGRLAHGQRPLGPMGPIRARGRGSWAQATGYTWRVYLPTVRHAPNRSIDLHPTTAYFAPNNRIHAPNRSIYMHPKAAYMPKSRIHAPKSRIHGSTGTSTLMTL